MGEGKIRQVKAFFSANAGSPLPDPDMRRVVVTGMGIVSCLGNDLSSVERSLREGRSGIQYVPEYEALGLRSHVAGIPDLAKEAPIARKQARFMGDAAAYAWYAMSKAVDDAGLVPSRISHPRIGLIAGSGVGSLFDAVAAIDKLRSAGLSKVRPYTVPKVMGNTVSACLSTAFAIRGCSYSITSACATSAHCIGHAADLIRLGKQDIVFAGGGEEVKWTSSSLFDAMGALSTAYNDATASRPFDLARDGFVIAGGAGILVLEELEQARARGARIYGELAGYGACSDGLDMVVPSPEGAARAMRLALDDAGCDIDYINAHATSTPLGDSSELEAIREVFGARPPLISSTKGQSGHAIAAAGVHEAIFSLLMLERGFVAGCVNVSQLDPACAGMPVVTSLLERRLDTVMSNSFGFGGANACLVFRRADS
jgi:3-oxoacyl-[acyl-carrier-protein] synthase-1